MPREVHRPMKYPEIKVRAERFLVKLVDRRFSYLTATGKSLPMPEDFVLRAESRLWEVASGQGPVLEVLVLVAGIEETELVDARGEISRLSVDLNIDVRVVNGESLRRHSVHSQAEIPRREATEQELQFLLRSTALNAFDRFWASQTTASRLNRALASTSDKTLSN